MTDLILTREESILIHRRRAGITNIMLFDMLVAAGKQVSRSTLYAATNDLSVGGISDATRERVLTAVEEVLEADDE